MVSQIMNRGIKGIKGAFVKGPISKKIGSFLKKIKDRLATSPRSTSSMKNTGRDENVKTKKQSVLAFEDSDMVMVSNADVEKAKYDEVLGKLQAHNNKLADLGGKLDTVEAELVPLAESKYIDQLRAEGKLAMQGKGFKPTASQYSFHKDMEVMNPSKIYVLDKNADASGVKALMSDIGAIKGQDIDNAIETLVALSDVQEKQDPLSGSRLRDTVEYHSKNQIMNVMASLKKIEISQTPLSEQQAVVIKHDLEIILELSARDDTEAGRRNLAVINGVKDQSDYETIQADVAKVHVNLTEHLDTVQEWVDGASLPKLQSVLHNICKTKCTDDLVKGSKELLQTLPNVNKTKVRKHRKQLLGQRDGLKKQMAYVKERKVALQKKAAMYLKRQQEKTQVNDKTSTASPAAPESYNDLLNDLHVDSGAFKIN